MALDAFIVPPNAVPHGASLIRRLRTVPPSVRVRTPVMPAAASAYVVGAITKRDSKSHLQGLTGSEGPDRRGKTNGGKNESYS
jgi:hypothetical protein